MKKLSAVSSDSYENGNRLMSHQSKTLRFTEDDDPQRRFTTESRRKGDCRESAKRRENGFRVGSANAERKDDQRLGKMKPIIKIVLRRFPRHRSLKFSVSLCLCDLCG